MRLQTYCLSVAVGEKVNVKGTVGIAVTIIDKAASTISKSTLRHSSFLGRTFGYLRFPPSEVTADLASLQDTRLRRTRYC